MPLVRLPAIGTVAAWRAAARALAAAGVPAEAVVWQVGEGCGTDDLLAADGPPAAAPGSPVLRLPRKAVAMIERALLHADPERFARAYAIVQRLAAGRLRWGDRSDPALNRLLVQESAVRHEIHKMHAFVRFREVTPQGAPRRAFAAWFEPAHPVTEAAAPFFARRFGDMDWAIATPQVTARFADGRLTFAPPVGNPPPPEDAAEALWRTYFAHIFNPARLKVRAMQAAMPKRYWRNLPEAALIPGLVRDAQARVRAMAEASPTTEPPAFAARHGRR